MSAKKEKNKILSKEKIQSNRRYSYGLGRRKTAVAAVKIFDLEKNSENTVMINGRKMTVYFPLTAYQNIILAPLKLCGLWGKVEVLVKVRGGGLKGQAEAIRLAISRALVEKDENFKKALKTAGYLTRDARIVERKKAGFKKARRAPQWQKR